MSDQESAIADLEAALLQWAVDRETAPARRARLVLAARAGGVTKNRIHVLSGIARTTIDEILAKADDPEMREALVRGVAQYILRGEAHTKNPPHTEAQVLARVRHDMAEMTAYDYSFPEGEAERIAASAAELARYQQDHDPNWDQWAFGH
jgi:hypothetical protein